jgi:membrane protease YdiL (CAAX protease family)
MALILTNLIERVHTQLGLELEAQAEVQLLVKADVATLITLVVGAVIVAPICEEIVFRLAIYEALRRKRSTVVAVVLTSLLFGVIHVTLPMLLPLALLGVLLQVSRLRHRSLWVAIIAHHIFNGFTVLAIISQRLLGGTL